MKKIMGGLRRNRNSIGSSSSTSDDAKINTPQEPSSTPDEVNYADLFDNDDDESENSKENKINNHHISQKQRVVKKKTIHKKRKKLNSQKLAASMKVMPMMTISEMVDCEESTEDEKEGEDEGGWRLMMRRRWEHTAWKRLRRKVDADRG